jgi:hypothetical protein
LLVVLQNIDSLKENEEDLLSWQWQEVF